MKPAIALCALSALALAGCGNITLISVGSVTKTAAGTGTPPPLAAQCAALAGATIKRGDTQLDAAQVCQDAVTAQAKQDRKR